MCAQRRFFFIVTVLAEFLHVDALLEDEPQVSLANHVTNSIVWPDSPSNFMENSSEDVSALERGFSSLHARDGDIESPARKQVVQAVLGVFTSLNKHSHEIRNVHRRTWMQHPSVCAFLNTSSACTLRVVFVAAAKGQEWINEWTTIVQGMKILEQEPDLLLLDTEPNPGSGTLAYSWLDFAASRFDWADYIGKMDDDVFPHVSNVIDILPAKLHFGTDFEPTEKFTALLEDLSIFRESCEAYLGKPWSCWGKETCPPTSCGPPLDGDFMKYNSTDNGTECWSYMKDNLYFLSRSLAFHLKTPYGFFDRHKGEAEDETLGKAVYTHVKDTRTCIRTLSSDDIIQDRLFRRNRFENEHPLAVSDSWDRFYGL